MCRDVKLRKFLVLDSFRVRNYHFFAVENIDFELKGRENDLPKKMKVLCLSRMNVAGRRRLESDRDSESNSNPFKRREYISEPLFAFIAAAAPPLVDQKPADQIPHSEGREEKPKGPERDENGGGVGIFGNPGLVR
jgi:hypothetical protein